MSEQKPMWIALINHMKEQHGVALSDPECDTVAKVADKCRMAAGHDGVTWILINALYNLNTEELKRLRDEIVKRIPEDGKSVREQLAGIEPCVWTEQEDGWFEACDGNAFEFTDGGPVENKVKWCPFCGRKIKVKKYEE